MVKQYSKLLAMDGVNLDITDDGLEAMAEEAIERGTGARALRSIFEKLMLDVMFDAPSQDGFTRVTLDREVVEGNCVAEVILEDPTDKDIESPDDDGDDDEKEAA